MREDAQRDSRADALVLPLDLSRSNGEIDRDLRRRFPRVVRLWWEIEPDGKTGWAYRGDSRIVAKLVTTSATS